MNCPVTIKKWARSYFSKDIYGLNSIFGRFVLVSDNFCVERRCGKYTLPTFNVAQVDQVAAQNEFEQRAQSQARRREFFSDLLDDVAKNFTKIKYTRPCYDTLSWVC